MIHAEYISRPAMTPGCHSRTKMPSKAATPIPIQFFHDMTWSHRGENYWHEGREKLISVGFLTEKGIAVLNLKDCYWQERSWQRGSSLIHWNHDWVSSRLQKDKTSHSGYLNNEWLLAVIWNDPLWNNKLNGIFNALDIICSNELIKKASVSLCIEDVLIN